MRHAWMRGGVGHNMSPQQEYIERETRLHERHQPLSAAQRIIVNDDCYRCRYCERLMGRCDCG